jgi:hypothetical protein
MVLPLGLVDWQHLPPNVPQSQFAPRLDHDRAKIADWVGDYNGRRPHRLSDPAAYAANLTATGDRLRNPTRSADRPLLHPRQSAYHPTGL